MTFPRSMVCPTCDGYGTARADQLAALADALEGATFAQVALAALEEVAALPEVRQALGRWLTLGGVSLPPEGTDPDRWLAERLAGAREAILRLGWAAESVG